jgi:Mrp family chromosome partitioning ATPase
MIRHLRPTGQTARVQHRSAGTAAPEYYALVRQLAGQDGSAVIRSLGVISAASGEGVSTVALQCALAAEQLFRQPVLLVEANLNRPSLARRFGLNPAGMSDLLLGLEPRDECLHKLGGNLWGCPAGSVVSQQVQSCSWEAMARAVDALQEGHRLTVWDLPAVEQNNLGLELASQLDGVLLVVEAERVAADVAQRAAEQLRGSGVKLLGAVLNKHRRHVPGWLEARL